MQSFFKLLSYIKGSKRKVFLASLYSFLNTCFDAMPEVILGLAIDTVINQNHSFLSQFVENSKIQLLLLGSITIIIYLLESFFEYLYSIEWRNLAQLVQHKLRVDAYNHVQSLDVSFFEDESTGNILSILVDDINLLDEFLGKSANDILQLGFSTFFVGLIFLYVSPTIALLSFLPIPLILIIAFYFKNMLNKSYADVRASAGKIAEKLSNNLFGILTIKNYTTEDYESNKVQKTSNTYMQACKRAIKISSLFIPLVRTAILIGYIITLVLGGIYALDGFIAIGAYSTLIFLTQRLLWPFTRVANLVDSYHRAMASTDRALKLLTRPAKVKSGNKKLELSLVKGNITFDNVSFIYPNGFSVLKDLSFTILPKQTIGFVGATGSGKTTITKLLLRYYDPTSGTILLDGDDITSYTINSMRNAFGVVSQDIFLTDGTITENIRYGSFNASFEDIVEAAKKAEAYDFIMQLPQQFDTTIGERGQKLSGGQKQRISIARALLKNPPIFIFDEATSAVDNETERAIQHSLNEITAHHTTLIIAHRLSTIKNADNIFVLEKGKIIDSGTHEELVKKDGLYAHLWQLQTRTEKAHD